MNPSYHVPLLASSISVDDEGRLLLPLPYVAPIVDDPSWLGFLGRAAAASPISSEPEASSRERTESGWLEEHTTFEDCKRKRKDHISL
jgi:hypothetical protein